MQNRRAFLKNMAYISAGSLTMTQIPSSLAQSARREIYIGGKRVKVVDIHAHCGFRATDDVVRGTSLERRESDNRIFGPEWIDWLDERGIDMQAMSVNRYWWYEADEALAAQITRVQDQGIAEWCAKHPDRFIGLSSVSIQHPELAAQ